MSTGAGLIFTFHALWYFFVEYICIADIFHMLQDIMQLSGLSLEISLWFTFTRRWLSDIAFLASKYTFLAVDIYGIVLWSFSSPMPQFLGQIIWWNFCNFFHRFCILKRMTIISIISQQMNDTFFLSSYTYFSVLMNILMVTMYFLAKILLVIFLSYVSHFISRLTERFRHFLSRPQ